MPSGPAAAEPAAGFLWHSDLCHSEVNTMHIKLSKKNQHAPVDLFVASEAGKPPIKHTFSSADFDKLLQFLQMVRQSKGIEVELELL
jgi:hypothetical protein